MKKIITILIGLLLCLSLTSCFTKQEEEEPVKKYDSIEEVNTLINVHLIPEPQASDETYYVYEDATAEYVYHLNGYKYYQRGCKDITVDICGVFKNGTTLFANVLDRPIAYDEASGYKVYRFLLGGKQYVFGVNDDGKLDKKEFEEQFYQFYEQEIYESTMMEVKLLIGNYQDSTSMRATLNFELEGVNEPLITIRWPNSENSYDEWQMHCTYDGYRFNYEKENIVHYVVTINEDSTLSQEKIDDYDEGYFDVANYVISWTGSGNKQTSSCVFEKID